MGLIFESNLRWKAHLCHLSTIVFKWSNLLRSLAGSWWGSHPSSMLQIYKSVIRPKVEFGCFLFGSAALCHQRKLNVLQSSCLRSAIGALKSTPIHSLNIETCCPPLHIRFRWLTGKFLLKCSHFSSSPIIDLFMSVNNNWRFVRRFLPLLSSLIQCYAPIYNHVLKVDKLPLYDTPYDALTFLPSITVDPNFLGYTPSELHLMPPCFTNNLFNQYINDHYSSSILVFTDGSVSSSSAGYSYFFPLLQIQSSVRISPYVSSFTAESCAILDALNCISSLSPGHFLIVSDSQSSLLAISGNPFVSKCSPVILKIRSVLWSLNSRSFVISFLWVPGHIGISGNEKADALARSLNNVFPSGSLFCPYSDLVPLLRRDINKLWLLEWESLPVSYSPAYKMISPVIPTQPWFQDLDIDRYIIVLYSRLRLGHNLLPFHAFKLGLNHSSACLLGNCREDSCDLSHLLFDCPTIAFNRHSLKSIFASCNTNFSYIHSLTSSNVLLIKSVIDYILQLGLKI